MYTLETAREIGEKSAHERQRKSIFPREGRLWNFCGTHKVHKRFLAESTGSTCVRKGTERQCGNGPHISVLMDINNLERRSLFTKLSLGITLVV